MESHQPLMLTMSDGDLEALLEKHQGTKPLTIPPSPPRIKVAPEIGKLQDFLSRVHFSLDEKRRPMVHFVFGEERTEEPRR